MRIVLIVLMIDGSIWKVIDVGIADTEYG